MSHLFSVIELAGNSGEQMSGSCNLQMKTRDLNGKVTWLHNQNMLIDSLDRTSLFYGVPTNLLALQESKERGF